MPARVIETTLAERSINCESRVPTLDDYSTIMATPFGFTLIEIQGELNMPKIKPELLNEEESKLFGKTKYPQLLTSKEESPLVDIVKFGSLEIEEDMKRATLFIGNSQRLIGNIVKLDKPLGVLKLVENEEENCEIVDIIEMKIIFKQRPLPIM